MEALKFLGNINNFVILYFHDNFRASVGVGVALMSYDTMVANQWRGKGLKMLHLYGDHLW